MATNDKKRKKYLYPLRNPEHTNEVTLIEVTKEEYYTLYKEIWATCKREQYHHRCMCEKQYLWKCDAHCDLCEYHTGYGSLSLDEPSEKGNCVLSDAIPDSRPSMEEVLSDALLLEQLIARLRELDPKADIILDLLSEGKSARDIAATLERPHMTYVDQMKRYREQLRKIYEG